MARPKSNPRMRFMDEIDIWAKAFAAHQTEGKDLIMTLPSPNAAIALNHKLNMARSYIRETEGRDGWHMWDVLAVRRKDCKVIIGLKQDTLNQIVSIEIGDEPITSAQIQGAKYKFDESNRLALEGFERARRRSSPIEPTQPKLDGQGRPIRGNEDIPDPTKPLID